MKFTTVIALLVLPQAVLARADRSFESESRVSALESRITDRVAARQGGKGNGADYVDEEHEYSGYAGKGKGKGGFVYEGKGKGKGGSKGSKGSKSSKASKGSKNGKGKNGGDVVIPVQTPAPSTAPTVAVAFNGTLVDFVATNPDLTTLTEAVLRAGLADALASEGPFTLFAPSNEAFAALDPDIFNQLFFDDNFIPQLQDLLLLHVLADEVLLAADLEVESLLFPLNGEVLLVDSPPLTVDGNNVVDVDNVASNGVAQIIDGVLLPSWVFFSLTESICSETDLSTLCALLVVAGIDLSGPAALTVVGPTDDAFALLDSTLVDFLVSPAGLTELQRILTYHVFFGILTTDILVDGFVQTLEGGLVSVAVAPLVFNQANAVEVDILANNGVLYKIDQVLNPDDSPVV